MFLINRQSRTGFTLVEVMIATAVAMVAFGTMIITAIALQRSFTATEVFSVSQSGQSRLLDYLQMDLRRAVGISMNGNKLQDNTPYHLAEGSFLDIKIPSFYSTDDPDKASYDETLPLVATVDSGGNLGVDYGTAGGAPTAVRYTYEFRQDRQSMCFVRTENGNSEVIVDRADTMDCDISQFENGSRVEIQVWFFSPFGDGTARVNSSGQVMIRNPRIDR